MAATPEERKVLGFLALMLTLSAAARGLDRPPEVTTDARPVDAAELARQDSVLLQGEEERARPLGGAERIDPNRAGLEALQRLPGVGPATAAAIVASREAEGPFRTADDLMRVRGIGPAKLGRMREHLALP
jgi:competence ComEA-like helix-hairpin-helix protein